MANRPNLRKYDRRPSKAKVELGWAGEFGAPKSALVVCKDVSSGGFRVVSRDAIPLRSYVQFRFAPINFRGSASVRSLNHVAAGYEIGFEFSGSDQIELERLSLLAGASMIK